MVDVLICFFIYSFIMLVSLFLWFKLEVLKDTPKKLIYGFEEKLWFLMGGRCWVGVAAAALGAPAVPSAALATSAVASARIGLHWPPARRGDVSPQGQHLLPTRGQRGRSRCQHQGCFREERQSFSSCPSENFYFFPLKGNK